jgi:ribosomal protein S11
MFRARILAQGFTLVAMVAGSMYWETDRKKRKEFDALVAERKAKEKNELWIKELEARDEEEKEYKAARERRRNGGVMEQRGVMDIVAEKTRETAEKSVGKPASGQTATKPVAESEGSKSVLESVQNLVWGGKK